MDIGTVTARFDLSRARCDDIFNDQKPDRSALTSFGLLLSLWIIGFLSNRGGKIGDFLGYLSLTEHFSDFSRGTVSFKHTVYYLSFTIVCLFFTVKSFESSKWR